MRYYLELDDRYCVNFAHLFQQASTGGVKPEVLGQLEELLGVAKLGVAEPGPSGEQGSQDAQDQGGGDNSGQNPPAVQAPVSGIVLCSILYCHILHTLTKTYHMQYDHTVWCYLMYC